jgi:hypothetical protein
MKFSEPRKKDMQQLEQEKFGVKVQSHDTIFCLVFLSTCFCQRYFNIGWYPIFIWVWGELYCENSEKDWVILESEFKVGLCGKLTIQLTCATDAESRGNQTVNHNVWLHGGYHDYEFKSQWISRYPFIYENEWNHNAKYSYKMQCH